MSKGFEKGGSRVSKGVGKGEREGCRERMGWERKGKVRSGK